jgi:putative OPT family oligopeptide transporter
MASRNEAPDPPAGKSGDVTPFTSPDSQAPEFTIKAALVGIVFGILFGAANTYLGLRVGLTISTSIPVAVMTVALFTAMRSARGSAHILEANMSQTIGSASSSVASGTLFTLPALFLWGHNPDLLQMTLLGMLGGLFGVLFMVPLRRLLIVREHAKLPYPEGTACAEVLKASLGGGARGRFVFAGLGLGALYKTIGGGFRLWTEEVHLPVPVIPKAVLGIDVSAALTGVGYILGFRVAAVMVGGGLLSALVIIPTIAIWGDARTVPLYPETENIIRDMDAGDIWTRYVRYIGAGAVAMGGLLTLIRSIPTMMSSFSMGAREVRQRLGGGAAVVLRTQQDLPLRVVFLGVGILTLIVASVPFLFTDVGTGLVRVFAAALIAMFAFFFVTVSSRIVGLVGVTSNPTSGMTIAALLGTSAVFYSMGWTDAIAKVNVLMIGTVVCVATSIAGDTSQDLKTGFLLGATPRKQQIGELVGVLTSAVFVCLTLRFLHISYGLGSEELPAPQATLMKLVIEGVLDAELPWAFVAIGAGLAFIVDMLRLPTLAFAVGVYLPVATMVPIFFGGTLRRFLEKSAPSTEVAEQRRERGVLFGSGLVGGEGLVGVGIAGVAFWLKRRPGYGSEWAGAILENVIGLLLIATLLWVIRRIATSSERG